jgi:predicted negative regulator of RcsB-dependent stress response
LVETDEEQVEVLKKWWEENGTSLVVAVVLALGANFGYRAWENNVRETGEAASAIYEDLVVASGNIVPGAEDDSMEKTAYSLGESLKADYSGTTYAVFAAMHLARMGVEAGDFDRAQRELQWVLDQGTDKHLETIARTRLARVMIAKSDPTAAMSLLINFKPSEGQLSSYEEVLGDVYHALGDDENARMSYQKALENVAEEVNKPLLELKLADIPLVENADLSEEATAVMIEDDDA